MKSMLYEASSVLKAIEQAWEASGKPNEFNVKILEAGEKGFLWITKQPAIISITYDPKKCAQAASATPPVAVKEKIKHEPRQQHGQQQREKQVNKHHEKRQHSHQQQPSERDRQQQRSQQQHRQKPAGPQHGQQTLQQAQQVKSQQIPAQQQNAQWEEEWLSCLKSHLHELEIHLPMLQKCTLTPDRKILKIAYTPLAQTSKEETHIINASLSYLLMQFLKKKYKTKFSGFSILITSKEQAANQDDKANEKHEKPSSSNNNSSH